MESVYLAVALCGLSLATLLVFVLLVLVGVRLLCLEEACRARQSEQDQKLATLDETLSELLASILPTKEK